MIGNLERLLRIGNRSQSAMCVIFICLQCVHHAYAAEKSIADYKDLRPISFLGSISVSVYTTTSDNSKSETDLSPEDLMQYLRLQFGRYFADIPYRSIDASRWSDPENRSSMGRLSCRVWSNVNSTPAVFQVKCKISTSDHLNIIDDTSLGYGPKEKAAAIVREHIDRILEGFALIFYRVRNEL
jgi:hypothetical protein